VARQTHLIRHRADVPILVSAIQAKPDYLVTTNTRHFTVVVARCTGLKIVTPQQLIARITIVG
jgi:predicted nucleic acid-binding protein